MAKSRLRWLATALCLPVALAISPRSSFSGQSDSDPDKARWATNGAAVFLRQPASPTPSNGTAPAHSELVFDHFLPDSLHHLIWTNLISLTNGRTISLWSVRQRPTGWPKVPPIVEWNTNCIAWGMKGLTGLSPCWEDEGAPGQAPITALTRRVGYTRGHSMGADGVTSNRTGKKVWFLTTNNVLVEAIIQRALIRLTGGRDYTLLLFTQDLPDSIEPLRVESGTNLLSRYRIFAGAPHPILKTEQGGMMSLDLPGFSVNTWKPGDSGSPDLLPISGELVFIGGRSTSSATPLMQTDMNVLCRIEGLNPDRYQLSWVDLWRWPSY